MSMQEWKMLISAYADHEVSDAEIKEAEELLATRPECRTYLKELVNLSSVLGSIEDESLSPDAEQNVAVQTLQGGTTMKKQARYLRRAGAVCATVVIAVLAFQFTQGDLERVVKGEVKVVKSVGTQPVQPMPVVPPQNSGQKVLAEVKEKAEAIARKAVEPLGEVANVVFGQAYLKRGLQGRLKSSADDIGDQFSLSQVAQYEPYYHSEALVSSPSSQGFYSSGVVGGMAFSRRSGFSKQVLFDEEGYYPPAEQGNTEEYALIQDNKFLSVKDAALSTFSIDVDTASYSNTRRFLNSNQMPQKDAVRIEEMINYFRYDYVRPEEGEPFSVTTDLATCPWNESHQLLRVGLRGKTPDLTNLPNSNVVFLIDTSGSMDSADKLGLLREGYKMMVRQLRAEDTVSIVAYAGSAGVVLKPTSGDQKEVIIAALDRLRAGGSTAGGAGIRLAYEIVQRNFIDGGNNRVVLATDGDFNVGVSSTGDLTRLVEEKRDTGVFLTVLGFGGGNLKDSRMESLADKGNGNYYYIDNHKEAKKVLVSELGSTLFTIAKDVKIQIEFNSSAVKAYRLIGYENRMLNKEDFNDDKKDAGEIGAGHTVTALYEIVPAGSEEEVGTDVDALKYQQPVAVEKPSTDEILTVKLRYKEPDADKSQLIEKVLKASDTIGAPTDDFAWAASVAEFGMLLRNSKYKGDASYAHVIKSAKANVGADEFGLRAEFVTLVEKAQSLAPIQTNGQLQFK